MPTTTLRLDDALRERIARIAKATDQTPHNFMLAALAQKADEAEWRLALQDEALKRDQALLAGEPTLEWHEVRTYLRARLADPGVVGPAGKARRR
jgi:predicted transcriptional regulator